MDEDAADMISRLLAPQRSLEDVASVLANAPWSPHGSLRGLVIGPVAPFVLTLSVNSVLAACVSEAACAGTLDPAVTPSITAVSPSTVGGVALLTVTGTQLAINSTITLGPCRRVPDSC
jgi:hypothetical protein